MNHSEFFTRYDATVSHEANWLSWDDYDIATDAFFEDVPLTASYMALATESMLLLHELQPSDTCPRCSRRPHACDCYDFYDEPYCPCAQCRDN